MTSKPTDRRMPHATPTRKAQPLPERAPEHATPSRIEAAMSLAERRRLRRLRKASDGSTPLPTVIPRGMPLRIYVSMRVFSGMIILLLVGLLYVFLTRDIFFIH